MPRRRLIGPRLQYKKEICGTESRYVYGCRCKECRKAHADRVKMCREISKKIHGVKSY